VNLKSKTIDGIKWTSISAMIIAIIQILQLSLLTHYLEPSDFGLMAIVMVVIGFSNMFLDLGIGAVIIHNQAITHDELSSLYWMNILIGTILSFTIYTIAPYIYFVYQEKELVSIIHILSISFIISSIGSQYTILFQKKLKFNIIAKINILSVSVAFIIAVISAIKGMGVYALVYAYLANVITLTIINILLGYKEYRPSFRYNFKEIKPMLSFGSFQMGERTLNYFHSQFDVILIGKLLGLEVLGIYNIAKTISMYPANMINPIINKVAFPIMAKFQNNSEKLKIMYLRMIGYIASINFPLYIILIILAEPIILTLFGEKWRGSIVILQILSIYTAIRSIGNPIGSLILARGRVKLGFYWNLFIFSCMPLVIYIGSFWGLEGIAYSMVIIMFLLMVIPNWYFLVKPLCGATYKEYMGTLLKPIVLALIGGFMMYIIMILVTPLVPPFWLIWIITISMVLVMTTLNLLFNRHFIETLWLLVKKREIE